MLLLAVAAALAHPHMFIDTEVDVRLSGSMLDGIFIVWYFDPMFTAVITGDFDIDRNGVFSPEEIEAVYAGAFSNLRNCNYFTFLNVNGQTLSPRHIEDFSVYMDGGTLVYEFFCPFDVEVSNNSFSLVIYDETFYCDILLRERNPISITGSEAAEYEIVQNRNVEISYGGSVSVQRDGASYSGTAYPQQLVVHMN